MNRVNLNTDSLNIIKRRFMPKSSSYFGVFKKISEVFFKQFFNPMNDYHPLYLKLIPLKIKNVNRFRLIFTL